MNKSNLQEGLRGGDLKDMVKDQISIDEFNSKIDDDAIVVSFFVKEKDAATDLSSFIESSGIDDVIDTEVSPSHDEDGYWLVFVEFLRSSQFPSKLKYTLGTLKNLTGIVKWTFTYYHGEKALPFNLRNVRSNVRLKKQPKENLVFTENQKFLNPSQLDKVKENGHTLILERLGKSYSFKHIAMGDEQLIMHLLNITRKPFALDDQSLKECRGIRQALGSNWDVNKVESYFILSNNFDPRIMVLSEKN